MCFKYILLLGFDMVHKEGKYGSVPLQRKQSLSWDIDCQPAVSNTCLCSRLIDQFSCVIWQQLALLFAVTTTNLRVFHDCYCCLVATKLCSLPISCARIYDIYLVIKCIIQLILFVELHIICFKNDLKMYQLFKL